MEEILRARREARQAVLEAREREEAELARRERERSEWLADLQTRATLARQVRPHPLTTHPHHTGVC